MRRKSERNKSKTAVEKKTAETTPRKTRRTSRRRKRSTSQSSSEDSDDAPLKPAVSETHENEVKSLAVEQKVSESRSNSDEDKQEQPIWKVKTSEAPSGEIQKLKICLQRPPTTPERTEKSPRRRRGKASSQSDDASSTPEEKHQKRKTRKSSPTTQVTEEFCLDNSVIEDAEKDECLIIVKETNEVMLGKGKLDCSQPSQEYENEEYVQDSRTVVQADESLIESKIEQDMEQDFAPVVNEVDEPSFQQKCHQVIKEQESLKENLIANEQEMEIVDTQQVEIQTENKQDDDNKDTSNLPKEIQEIEKTTEITKQLHEQEKLNIKCEEELQIKIEPESINVKIEREVENITELDTNQIQCKTEEVLNDNKQVNKPLVETSEKIADPEEPPIKENNELIIKSELQELDTKEQGIEISKQNDEIVKQETEILEQNDEIVKQETEVLEQNDEIVKQETEIPKQNDEIVKQGTEISKENDANEKQEIEILKQKSDIVNQEIEIQKQEIKIQKQEIGTQLQEMKTEEQEINNEKEDLQNENVENVSMKVQNKEVDVNQKPELISAEIKEEKEIKSVEEMPCDDLKPDEEDKSSNATSEEVKNNDSLMEINQSFLNEQEMSTSENEKDSQSTSLETKVSPNEEKIEDTNERKIRKRNWGKYKANVLEEPCITFNVISSLFPSVKVLSTEELKLETEEIVRESKNIKKDREISVQLSLSPKEEDFEKEISNIGLNRKISIVNDDASKLQPPPSPAKNPLSSILYITNLVRPFTLKQLQELLSRTGKIIENGFWTDKIKSKCFVQYETEEEAENTRNALHGVQWPTGNGKKLMIDFGTAESMTAAKNAIVEVAPPKSAPDKTAEKVPESKKEEENDRWEKPRAIAAIREWDLGKVQQDHEHSPNLDRTQSRSDRSDKKRPSRNESPSNGEHLSPRKKKKENPEVKMMDDLFHKTKATPSIYWLPLSPEQIAKKQQQRLQRMAEHKRRMEESRRMERDFGRGAPRSRRRASRYDGD